jgi:HEAT repeats
VKIRQSVALLLVVASAAAAQTSPPPDVVAAIDSWQTRAATRDAISRVGGDPVPILISIASSKTEPDVRRTHAIALLATFRDPRSEHALNQETNDGDPRYRCLALQSLVEQQSRRAIPALIKKLDDHAACMKSRSSDPSTEIDVYVSDEAVRLLELVTRISFEHANGGTHKETQPWKDWWLKEKTTRSNPNPKG